MVRLRFETDLATSLKAVADLNAASDKLGKSWNAGAREANALEKAAKRIVDQNLTPQEKYNQKLEQMAKAVKAGRLSMEEAERTAGRMRQRLDEVEKAGRQTFGQNAISQLAGYAAGLVSIQTIFGTLLENFKELEERRKQAASNVTGGLGGFGELQQVATSPQDFQKLVGQARGFVRKGVFGQGQQGQAADLVFALRNAGYSDAEIGFITELGTSRQVKPENLQKVAEGLKKYQDTFGVAEAGGIEGVGKKLFSAAGATQADFATVAQAATLFGSEAKALGFSDEEALAAFVAIEKQSPGSEEAATRLRSLLTQISKDKTLQKGTLGETLAALSARVNKGEAAIDIVNETRAAAGLNILSGAEGQGVFAQQVREITAAQSGDIINQRRFLRGDPQLAAASARQQQVSSRDLQVEELDAERKLHVESIRAGRLRRASEGGRLFEFFENLGQILPELLQPSDYVTISGEARGGFQNVGKNSEAAASIRDYLRRMAESNERMEGSQAPGPGGRQE